jgi:hypothetical protein
MVVGRGGRLSRRTRAGIQQEDDDQGHAQQRRADAGGDDGMRDLTRETRKGWSPDGLLAVSASGHELSFGRVRRTRAA